MLADLRENGPCIPDSYRISGDLDRYLCGIHLAGNWRLAYSADPPNERIYILFVDTYLDGVNLWSEFLALMGLENPARHPKPDCCDPSLAPLDLLPDHYLNDLEDALHDHMKEKHGRL